MFKKLICSLIILFLLAGTEYASGCFRCGHNLVEIGDPKFLVIQECGPPVSAEVIGCANKAHGLKIVELVYGPTGGVYYYLTFTGNKLTKIESVKH